MSVRQNAAGIWEVCDNVSSIVVENFSSRSKAREFNARYAHGTPTSGKTIPPKAPVVTNAPKPVAKPAGAVQVTGYYKNPVKTEKGWEIQTLGKDNVYITSQFFASRDAQRDTFNTLKSTIHVDRVSTTIPEVKANTKPVPPKVDRTQVSTAPVKPIEQANPTTTSPAPSKGLTSPNIPPKYNAYGKNVTNRKACLDKRSGYWDITVNGVYVGTCRTYPMAHDALKWMKERKVKSLVGFADAFHRGI